ncbi:hypothetical protein H4219_006282 [Mycoemilia scoparia]|uniref:Uncharacterized protein n=1 Tax=Mycoemilia scoparia TaxID=417184 RepID=A0A9W7ZRY6_9FUNG|nr:hypothetical protein H4219_006282 [Mycoemilia scoparia]
MSSSQNIEKCQVIYDKNLEKDVDEFCKLVGVQESEAYGKLIFFPQKDHNGKFIAYYTAHNMYHQQIRTPRLDTNEVIHAKYMIAQKNVNISNSDTLEIVFVYQ